MADDVARAAAGDVSAFERVYRTHLPRVHGLVRRMTGGRDTDEVTQDVFVRVAGSASIPGEDGQRRAWIFRIARNLAIDHQRRRAVRPRACRARAI